jgi:hypothetical protein
MMRYGDNIYHIAGAVRGTLRRAEWPAQKIDAVMKKITEAQSYDSAIEICREYITIENED